MAGGVFSGAKLYGMTIRESANDGSDFTSPDVDYRRLFLGEDGSLYTKDSAGTVAAIGAADVAAHTGDATDAHDASAISVLDTAGHFDATEVEAALAEAYDDFEAHVGAADPHTGYVLESLLDAKGDIIAASADNTPAKVTVGTNGSTLRAASGETAGIEWQKNSLANAVAPAVTDDAASGYTVGSRWIDTTADKEYVLLDSTAGAAVWTETTQSGGSTVTTTPQDLAIADGGSAMDVLPGVSVWGTGTATGGATDRILYTPLVISQTLHLDALVCEVTAGNSAGRTARLALYEADASMQPGDRIAEGSVDCSTTGEKTVAANVDLPAGRYLSAITMSDSAIAVRHHSGAMPWVLSGTSSPVTVHKDRASFAALPDPGVAWDTVGTSTTFGWRCRVWL